MPRRRRPAARRSPAPCARFRRRRRRAAARTSSRRRPRPSPPRAHRSARRAPRGRTRPNSARRVARLVRPELGSAPRRLELPHVEQRMGAHDAMPVVRVDSRGGPRRAPGEPRVQRRRARPANAPPSARAPRRAAADAFELGERRAQVQAGASDDDRPPAGREQRVDLGVRELGVLADAERRIERQERDQPVLQAHALGCLRDPGEDLQPGVDLQRVGGDRNRFLAGPAQDVGEREGDGRLADARGAEHRQHSAGGTAPGEQLRRRPWAGVSWPG